NANGDYPATSLALDAGGNLWVSRIFDTEELAVRTKEGMWHHYSVPLFFRTFRLAFGLLVDDYNQKWYFSPLGGGVIVYDDKGTPDNGADDESAQLTLGKGQGNLPNSSVRCMAKDRDGAIWIGTENGIGIVSCPGDAISGNCE